ncbi:hypothetical protein ABZ864_06005 [Streptomyces sp. NPDC047082]|uniref:hypothetical protein n=1 Tax=Streptomyces sp. NPDC047082 TaxID=3155259 RepID=UPI0033F26D9E
MSDDQFKQVLQLLSAIEIRLSGVETRLVEHQEESRKEHGEMGDLIGGLSEHTDKTVAAASDKVVQMLTSRFSATLQEHDKRITRVEEHVGLPPLK